MDTLDDWLHGRGITEVECLVPDMSGIARGKILPDDKFLDSFANKGLRIPEFVFVQTVNGDAPESGVIRVEMVDVFMQPDPETIRMVPWYDEPTAQVICDCFYFDGSPVDISGRYVLQRVLRLYEERGWKPLVAPELEFFLVKVNPDPDYPLEPPTGRSGRSETAPQAFGIDATNEFDPLFEDLFDYCEAMGLNIDTLTHEAGAAQMEMNFHHGDPLALADQAFLFKRTLRETALRHNVYATFMAKPMEDEPGSAMHIHQSVVDSATGRNLFADADGRDTPLFLAHIAGLQRYLPAAMPLVAPNVNSYRRLQRYSDAPINTHWGRDNRTVGFRVPHSEGPARRVENRVAGADANPYLAIAASLACGYLGMVEDRAPDEPFVGSAYKKDYTLPRSLPDALAQMRQCVPLHETLGTRFLQAVEAVKQVEHEAYHRVISSWEREFLLLNV